MKLDLAVPVRVTKNLEVFPCFVDGSQLTTVDEFVMLNDEIVYLGEIGKEIPYPKFNNANFKLVYRLFNDDTVSHILVCNDACLEDIRHAIFVRLIRPTNNIIALGMNPPKVDERFLTYSDTHVLFYYNNKPFIRGRKTEREFGEC